MGRMCWSLSRTWRCKTTTGHDAACRTEEPNVWKSLNCGKKIREGCLGIQTPRVEIAYTSHCVSLHHVLQYNVVHLAMTQIAFCTCWDSCRFQADTCRVLGRWTLTELVFSDTCKPKKILVAGFRQRHWWTKIPSLVYFWPGKCFFRSDEPAWLDLLCISLSMGWESGQQVWIEPHYIKQEASGNPFPWN